MRALFDTSVLVAAVVVSDYQEVIDRMAEQGLAGGIVYDALIARAAEKSGAAQLVTFNERDFQRLLPKESKIVVVRPRPHPETS